MFYTYKRTPALRRRSSRKERFPKGWIVALCRLNWSSILFRLNIVTQSNAALFLKACDRRIICADLFQVDFGICTKRRNLSEFRDLDWNG